jgi:predicted metal-dependent hydrolase
MNSFSYKTIFTKRKTISIILSPTGKITIRAPYGTPKKTIEDLLNKKAGWIQKHLAKYTDYQRLARTEHIVTESLCFSLAKSTF